MTQARQFLLPACLSVLRQAGVVFCRETIDNNGDNKGVCVGGGMSARMRDAT